MSEATIVMTDTGPIGLVLPKPERSDLTENELSWIRFLRALSDGSDPAPSLALVQAIRAALGETCKQIDHGRLAMMSPRATFA